LDQKLEDYWQMHIKTNASEPARTRHIAKTKGGPFRLEKSVGSSRNRSAVSRMAEYRSDNNMLREQIESAFSRFRRSGLHSGQRSARLAAKGTATASLAANQTEGGLARGVSRREHDLRRSRLPRAPDASPERAATPDLQGARISSVAENLLNPNCLQPLNPNLLHTSLLSS
jgi:hypothetical protein